MEDRGHLPQAHHSFDEPRGESLVKLMFGAVEQMLSQETSERDVNTALLPTLHVGESWCLGEIALPWPCLIMGKPNFHFLCVFAAIGSRVKEGFDVAVKIW